eukprot:11427655-Ditylum_brightwellii.AAC.1
MDLGVIMEKKSKNTKALASSTEKDMHEKEEKEDEPKALHMKQKNSREKEAALATFVEHEIMATFNHMGSDDEEEENDYDNQKEEEEEEEIDDDNVYSLSAAAATTTSATNRRGGGGYEEYEDEPDYDFSQVQHNDDDDDDDEYGFMDSTVWAEQQLRLAAARTHVEKNDAEDIQDIETEFKGVSLKKEANTINAISIEEQKAYEGSKVVSEQITTNEKGGGEEEAAKES